MDNLNLGSDESIRKKIPKIIINGLRYEAILTTRRIILATRDDGVIHEDIPYPNVTLAASGVNSIREPVLKLTFITSAGEEKTLELIFVYQAGGMNTRDLENGLAVLKDSGVTVREMGNLTLAAPMNRVLAVSPGMSSDDEPDLRPAVPDMTIMSSRYNKPQPLPKDFWKRPVFLAGAVIVIVIAIIFMGALIGGKPPAQGTPVPVQQVVPVQTPMGGSQSPFPITTQYDVPPPVVTVISPPPIPTNGIWVRISYPGRYTGFVKAQGWNNEVNSTGVQFYQLPVHDTMVEGLIEKTDGSGGTMDVTVYNGGESIFSGSTSKPFGQIQIRQEVGPALVRNPSQTPAPTPAVTAIPTPDTSIVLKEVPATGTFVRISYPGEFTGSISANGQERVVEGSGDQFFQMPVNSGDYVDGTVEKPDGTDRSLVVQIYKDGGLISAMNTIKPHGTVVFHTLV
jgi:hypothetical protein